MITFDIVWCKFVITTWNFEKLAYSTNVIVNCRGGCGHMQYYRKKSFTLNTYAFIKYVSVNDPNELIQRILNHWNTKQNYGTWI